MMQEIMVEAELVDLYRGYRIEKSWINKGNLLIRDSVLYKAYTTDKVFCFSDKDLTCLKQKIDTICSQKNR